MEILVIDDLRSFPPLEVAHEVTYARTSQEALIILKERHARGAGFDEVWFDHDLGKKTGVIDDVKPVVDWIQSKFVWEDPPLIERVVVHTSNLVGAGMIVRAFQRYLPVRQVDAPSVGGIITEEYEQED